MITEPSKRILLALAVVLLSLGAAGCAAPSATHDHEHGETGDHEEHGGHEEHGEAHDHGAESWSVTAWGERYEVFPDAAPLVAGEAIEAHTHVTRLDGFRPLTEGKVEIVLTGSSGEQVFGVDQAARPGIFNVEIRPERAGEVDLTFRIHGSEGAEEIRGGRVLVGGGGESGRLLVAPAPKGADSGSEPLEFLKEEQWRTDFGTAWVRTGLLARSVAGLARIRPPAGGEVMITASIDGVLTPSGRPSSWPFAGYTAKGGQPLFRLVPRVAEDQSLPSLEATLATLEAERATAKARLSRLEELLELEATSQREVEEARALLLSLEARHGAASRDLKAARWSREGGSRERGTAGEITLRAPFRGEVSKVLALPGSTVAAGEALARMVRTDKVWIEAALPPEAARGLKEGGVAGVVLSDGENPPLRIEEACAWSPLPRSFHHARAR